MNLSNEFKETTNILFGKADVSMANVSVNRINEETAMFARIRHMVFIMLNLRSVGGRPL